VSTRRVGSRWPRDAGLGLLFVAPVALVIVLFVLIPLGVGFDFSFRSLVYGSGIPDHYVGLSNYRAVATTSSVIQATAHTVTYIIAAVVLEMAGGLAVALALRHAFRGRAAILAILVLPWALPAVIRSTVWVRILQPGTGFLNDILVHLHVISTINHNWFAASVTGIFFISLVQVSGVFPLTTLILLAGLQAIPESLFAVAAVDGASAWQKFVRITLPLLRPSIAVAAFIGVVQAASIFTEIYVLNGSALDTRSAAMQVYFTAFQQLNFGAGEAMIFLLTAVFGGAFLLVRIVSSRVWA